MLTASELGMLCARHRIKSASWLTEGIRSWSAPKPPDMNLTKDQKPQAIVLSSKRFQEVGYIMVLFANGDEMDLFADNFGSDGTLVIFPEEKRVIRRNLFGDMR